MSAGLDLQQLIAALSADMQSVELDHAARFDPPLSAQELAVLRAIEATPGMKMSVLSERTGMPLSSATDVVGRLARRDLVARTRPEDNRRVVVVTLNPNGTALMGSIARDRQDVCDRLLDGFGAAEAEMLRRLLDRAGGGGQGHDRRN